MQIELRVAKAIGESARPRNQFGTQHIAVERVRAFPVGNMNDAVVELDGQGHRILRVIAASGCPKVAVTSTARNAEQRRRRRQPTFMNSRDYPFARNKRPRSRSPPR